MEVMLLLKTIILITFTHIEACEPRSGTDYSGCDLKYENNITSWKECGQICCYTNGYQYWTWAHADSTYWSLTCWLKKNKCKVRPGVNFISGDKYCTNTSRNSSELICRPKYGYDYHNCNMKTVENVESWHKCSKFCLFTQGCLRWPWAHKGHPTVPYSCWIKDKICTGKMSFYFISGDSLTYLRCELSRNRF